MTKIDLRDQVYILEKIQLYRETGIESEKKCQLVLPLAFIEQVLSGLYNDMGHPNKDPRL